LVGFVDVVQFFCAKYGEIPMVSLLTGASNVGGI